MVGAADAEGYPVPTCAWHPDRAPIAACVLCGRVMCRACASMGPDGYVCPECAPARGAGRRRAGCAGGAAAERARRAARRKTRQLALLGLVPVIGVPAALAAVLLAAADLRRPADGRRGIVLSFVMGLAGLLATAVIVGIYVTR